MSNIHVGKRVFIGGRLYVVRVFDAITNAARVESVDGFLTDVDASTFDDETPSYRAGALPAVEVKYTTGASLADVRPLTCDIPIDVAECGTCGAPLPLFSSEAMAHERCNVRVCPSVEVEAGVACSCRRRNRLLAALGEKKTGQGNCSGKTLAARASKAKEKKT